MSRTQCARATNANHGAYREDAAAVEGLQKLGQGAGELNRANLGPEVDHWSDADGLPLAGGGGVRVFVLFAAARVQAAAHWQGPHG